MLIPEKIGLLLASVPLGVSLLAAPAQAHVIRFFEQNFQDVEADSCSGEAVFFTGFTTGRIMEFARPDGIHEIVDSFIVHATGTGESGTGTYILNTSARRVTIGQDQTIRARQSIISKGHTDINSVVLVIDTRNNHTGITFICH